MTNKKPNKLKSLLGGLGLAALTVLAPKVNAQDVDFTQSGSVGSRETREAIMEHGNVYAFKEVNESRDNPLGIEKYPVSKMKGNKPSVVFTPYEIDGNRIILNNEGKFAKKPEDATPTYNIDDLDIQGDKLKIETKDFSNLFKTLVIKGSDGINDTVYYFHQPVNGNTQQNVVWAYKDDVQDIGVTNDGQNYYVQTDEIYGWKVNENKTTGSLEGILNQKYPNRYELTEPTTGEVKEILEVDEDPSYSPYEDRSRKRNGNGIDWARLKFGVNAYGGGASLGGGEESSLTGGASATGALQFGRNGLFIGPYATYTPEWFSSTSSKTESLDEKKEVLNVNSGTAKTTTGEKTTETTLSYPYGVGVMTSYQIGDNSELSLKLGVAQQYQNQNITGKKNVTYTRGDDTLSTKTLFPENGAVTRQSSQIVPTGALRFEHYFGNSNWSFGAEAGSKYYDGKFDVSGEFSINYTINGNKSGGRR
jgi:hypothetical protein